MDQKLVADILQAEVQVGRKINQNQVNLRQFEEFTPDSAFESLKKFYINSHSLSRSAVSQQNLGYSKSGSSSLGSTFKGVIDLEKLTLLYRQYEESVSSFEIQAILQRHSAASDKGMDYDCFLKMIGYSTSDTKRKNQIFDSVIKQDKPLSERCMKALSSIFLLELDLLRFTEVHKVSLVNNYSFDATNMFAKIDTQNTSQIDFEMLQSFFRLNGQEFSLQDYDILLKRVKKGRHFEQKFLTRQDFIQVVGPQLPYRGKNNTNQQTVPSFVQAGESRVQPINQGQKSVRFSSNIKDSSNTSQNIFESTSFGLQNSVTQSQQLQQQQQTDLLRSQQSVNLQQSQAQILQSTVKPAISQSIQQQTNSSSQDIFQNSQPEYVLQNQQMYAPQTVQQVQTPLFAQPNGIRNQYVQSQGPILINAPLNTLPQVIPTGTLTTSLPQPLPLVQFVPTVPLVYPQPVPQVVYQNSYIPPLQNQVVEKTEDHQQNDENIVDNYQYSSSNRQNLALEAMNELLKQDNEKLRKENEQLTKQKLEAEQQTLRAREKEQMRREILEEQRLELLSLQQAKSAPAPQKQPEQQQQKQQQQQQQLQKQVLTQQKPVQTIVSPPIKQVVTQALPSVVAQTVAPISYVSSPTTRITSVASPRVIPAPLNTQPQVNQFYPQETIIYQSQQPLVQELLPSYYIEPKGYQQEQLQQQQQQQQKFDPNAPFYVLPQNQPQYGQYSYNYYDAYAEPQHLASTSSLQNYYVPQQY